MVRHNLVSVALLCRVLELAKVIDEGSHAGREVQHTVHQVVERDFS